MRVILDTNVFVSGVFFAGPPHRILEAWRDGKLQVVLTQEILEEYQRVGEVLAEQFPVVELRPMIEWVTMNAEVFPSQTMPEPISADPDDDKFIACALISRCKLIVSGDRHLLKVSGYGGIRVMKPRQFVTQMLSGRKE